MSRNVSESAGLLRDAALMIAAFVLNSTLLIPIFGSLTMHFGQALGLLALLLFGRRSGLLVSLAAGAGLSWTLGGWLGPPLAVIETAAIAWLLTRRVPFIPSALIFWLAIGLPLNYLLAIYPVGMDEGYLWVGVLKQAINGLLNAGLAAGALIVIVGLRMLPTAGSFRHVSLFRQVFSLVVTLIVLPALVVALILVNRSIEVVGSEIDRRLVQRAQDYALISEAYIDRHETAVGVFAKEAGVDGPLAEERALFARLDRFQQAYPGFLTMLVADADGTIVHGAPDDFYRRLLALPGDRANVADRRYFQVPRDQGRLHLSGGLQGRGFGNDPIVAISAPLTSPDGGFLGIVEGSLNLPKFARIEAILDSSESVIVTDSSGAVLYAPDGLSVEPLSRIDVEPDNRFRIAPIDQVAINGTRFFIESTSTADGWRIHALSRTRVVEDEIARFLLIFLAGLSVLIVVAWWLSRLLARAVTRPLSSLVEQILAPDARTIRIDDDDRISPEFVAVAEALDQARKLSLDFQETLERTVDAKTEELERANRALQALSVQDALTGILNRRGLEAGAESLIGLTQRERLTLTVAVIDIDNLKEVNDRFGHAAGDRCLVELAGLLRLMFRRGGDLGARTGGDEFVVMIAGADADAAEQRLEEFRRAAGSLSIELDDGHCALTVSIGVISIVPDASASVPDLDDLVQKADRALYRSKDAGRNRLTRARNDE